MSVFRLQAQLLPLCGAADLACGQLPLLASMRKFLVKASNIPEPDRTAAMTTATKLAEMVARLACYCSGTAAGGQAGVLLQHAAAQLLPAFQVGTARVALFVSKKKYALCSCHTMLNAANACMTSLVSSDVIMPCALVLLFVTGVLRLYAQGRRASAMHYQL
jgi:hypothetical protein